MDFQEWEPYYRQILLDFGYEGAMDQASAELLQAISTKLSLCDETCLRKRMGREVDICGNSPGLDYELEEELLAGPVIAAGSATETLMDFGIVPDMIFSDLDGYVEAEIEANANGAIAVILAHGDNMGLISKWAPRFKGSVMLTCQCRPFGMLRNYGGFTDGDRAVMTARHLGVRTIRLHGFDFSNPRSKPGSSAEIKIKKLAWAKRIIYELNTADVRLVEHG
ncbi:MAG: 6-hydroxymethyl-7,8-dihydropterin pyrophosphokinase [Methanomassiliicoccales archaeon PtaU1.Bin124]|nr:MAG: 6-hydroxymethyl-7,8-dihydropterin pyrophosphokinase [Methanomassiliicoccales archaeon PtaU1.Bin124]